MGSVFGNLTGLQWILNGARINSISIIEVNPLSKAPEIIVMMTPSQQYLQQLTEEIQLTPLEYLPMLLSIVKSYRESVMLKPAADSFRQGWQETLAGDIYPLDSLWDGMETD